MTFPARSLPTTQEESVTDQPPASADPNADEVARLWWTPVPHADDAEHIRQAWPELAAALDRLCVTPAGPRPSPDPTLLDDIRAYLRQPDDGPRTARGMLHRAAHQLDRPGVQSQPAEQRPEPSGPTQGGTPLADFVEHFRTDLVYAAPETWPGRISGFLDDLVARYNPLIEGTAEEAVIDVPSEPTQEQLLALRQRHPVPWRPDVFAFGSVLADARGDEVDTTGLEQLVADAVNAHVGNAHHTEETR